MPRQFDRDPSHGSNEPPRTPPAGGEGSNRSRHATGQDEFPHPEPAGPSTEPRGKRAGRPSSQGLAGAQGSGGGAERGMNQPPPLAKSRSGSASAAPRDDSGLDPAAGADSD